MRDTLGGVPYEAKKDGSKYVINFYPHVKDAKNPDAVPFGLAMTRDDLKKLAKIGAWPWTGPSTMAKNCSKCGEAASGIGNKCAKCGNIGVDIRISVTENLLIKENFSRLRVRETFKRNYYVAISLLAIAITPPIFSQLPVELAIALGILASTFASFVIVRPGNTVIEKERA